MNWGNLSSKSSPHPHLRLIRAYDSVISLGSKKRKSRKKPQNLEAVWKKYKGTTWGATEGTRKMQRFEGGHGKNKGKGGECRRRKLEQH